MNKIKTFIQNKQKSLLYIVAQVIIVFILILVVLLGFSYGYLGPVDPEDVKTTVDVSSSETSELFFTKGTDVSLTIGSENFTESTGFVTSEAVSTATLKKSAEIASVTEKYQVYLNIKDNNYVYTTAAKTPELILTITNPAGEVVTSIDGLNYVTSTDPNTGAVVSGFDITTHKGLIKIAEDYSITTTSEKVDNWKIEVTFVDLATNQEANEGRTFSSDFLLQADKIILLNDHIIELHAGTDGSNDLYYTNNAEYRYSGETPNNYVLFNDELWRIIGVFDDNSHGVTDTNLVKIIKEEKIGNYMFDNKVDNYGNGYNSWSDDSGGAEINQLLNSYYYNSNAAPYNLAGCESPGQIYDSMSTCDFTTIGISDYYRNMIQESTWYLGGFSLAETTASEAYIAERGDSTSNSPGAHQKFIGNIGLMYASDYRYGSYPSGWDIGMDEAHREINWLNPSDARTITPFTKVSSYVWSVHISYLDEFDANLDLDIFPVLYLNTNVRITDGTGTETNPYLLEM